MKGARPTRIRVTADGARLGGLTLVAQTLGVRTQQVSRWVARRADYGFPEPVERGPITGHAEVDLYDLDACRAWRLTHPSRLGVPLRVHSTDPNRKGAADVARALGVEPRRLFKWAKRTGAPQRGEDGLYDLQEWRVWLAAREAA